MKEKLGYQVNLENSYVVPRQIQGAKNLRTLHSNLHNQ